MVIITKNSLETKKIANNLADSILRKGPLRAATLVSLTGDLGAGKTTFTQGFARRLNVKEKILSPTFVILKIFKIAKIKNIIRRAHNGGRRRVEAQDSKIARFKNFYHIDCYRINNSEEILSLGWKEIINNPENIVVVEWANKIKEILPKQKIILKFAIIGKNKRKIGIFGIDSRIVS